MEGNVELYLSLTGPNGKVPGNVQAAGYVDQIDLVDWSWGLDLSDEYSQASASGGKTNRARARSLGIKKRLDRSSTVLMAGAANLTTFPKAVITLLHRVEHEVRVAVTLQGVRIAKYELTVTDADPAVTMEESIDLSFQSINIEYVSRMNDAGLDGKSKEGSKIGPMSFEMREG